MLPYRSSTAQPAVTTVISGEFSQSNSYLAMVVGRDKVLELKAFRDIEWVFVAPCSAHCKKSPLQRQRQGWLSACPAHSPVWIKSRITSRRSIAGRRSS